MPKMPCAKDEVPSVVEARILQGTMEQLGYNELDVLLTSFARQRRGTITVMREPHDDGMAHWDFRVEISGEVPEVTVEIVALIAERNKKLAKVDC